MNDEARPVLFDCVVLVFLFVLGVLIGWCATELACRNQAIERGFAEYNSETGAWQWKEAADADE